MANQGNLRVHFVSLAPITDPALVPTTIAASFGVSDVAGPQIMGALQECLRDRSVLLTQRQREVAALVARGYTNRRIAETLVISERTAEHRLISGTDT